MQFLYADGTDAHFMDTESYEQMAVPEAGRRRGAALDEAQRRGRRAVHRRAARATCSCRRRSSSRSPQTEPGPARRHRLGRRQQAGDARDRRDDPGPAVRRHRRPREGRHALGRVHVARADGADAAAPTSAAPPSSRSTSTTSPAASSTTSSSATRRPFTRALAYAAEDYGEDLDALIERHAQRLDARPHRAAGAGDHAHRAARDAAPRRGARRHARSRPRARSTRRSRRPRRFCGAEAPGFVNGILAAALREMRRECGDRMTEVDTTTLDALVARLERAAEQLRTGDLVARRRRRPGRGLRRAGLAGLGRARAHGRARAAAGAAARARTRCCERSTRRLPRRTCATQVERYLDGAALPERRAARPPASRRRCATRCWPAASASGPVLALATARALGREPDERAAAGRRDRADPHLLADPRRPAGDGRRRPAPRPARPATCSSARTSRSSPATRSTPRPSATCSTRAGGRARAACSPPPRELAAATGVDGMVGGQYVDVAGLARTRPRSCARLHELKTGRLIGASRGVRTAAGGHGRDRDNRLPALRGRARRAVPDRRRHPRRDRHRRRRWASRRAATSATASAPTSAEFGLDGARELAARVPRKRARRARARPRRTGAAELEQITDFILTRDLMTHAPASSTASTARRTSTTSSEDELAQVAQEVREHIIDTVGEIGGHFGANLGTCELAVALHSLLDSPRDKILWDVGHQAYPHKVLTGRRDQLPTIRQYEGLAPFCSIDESEHDIMGAGHASTSIGYAVGLKEAHAPARRARRRQGRRRHRRRRDDRRRRLRGDPPGRRPRHADRRRPQRQRHVDRAERRRAVALLQPRPPEPEAVARARGRRGEARPSCRPASARRFERLGPQLKESIKAFWAPGLLWEELDWAYIGVIDGHDVRALRARAARRRSTAERPVVVHIATVKGKGFAPGRGRRPRGHGEVARRQAEVDRQRRARRRPSRSRRRRAAPPQYTQVFGEAMVARGAARPARRRHHRRDELRHRAQHPAEGRCPTTTSTSASPSSRRCCSPPASRSRASSRCARSTRPSCSAPTTRSSTTSACRSSTSSFAMDRAGLVGDDGPTHHGAFDIAYLRCLPNIVLMAPRDEAMLVAHAAHRADLRRRPGRAALPARRGRRRRRCPARRRRSRSARGEILREGERVALVGYGTGVQKALEAADLLAERGLDVTVADARFAKPLDAELLAAARRRARPARHGRGGRAGRRLRLGRVGGAQRRRRPRPADPARRPARPLRHPRQAGAAARRGRLHRPGDRRAHRGRHRRPATGALASA